jgi:hypothetical protein
MIIGMVSDYRVTAVLPLPLLAVHFSYLRLLRRQEVAAKYRDRTSRVTWPSILLHMHCEQNDAAVQTLL